jgi:hypothetical protein
MRALEGLVIGLGVVIVAMVVTIVVTLVHRHGIAPAPPAAAAAVSLDEPAGTRIGAVSALGDRLAVLLQGGGPDRLVFLDAGGRVVGRVALRR